MFTNLRRTSCAITALCLICVGRCLAQSMVVSADHADGVYKSGDTVHWTCEWKGDGAAPAAAKYVLKSGGLKEVGQGTLTFDGNAAKFDSKFDTPGTLLVEVKWEPASPRNMTTGGAVADPSKILPAAEEPADFDVFWKAKVEELEKVPANVKLDDAEGGKPGVQYKKLTMDNIRGTHIRGQVARPESGEKFPALLIVQWAGVYPLQKGWVTDRAKDGWLALNIMAHDLPIDEPEAFYKEQFAGPLKDYWAIGNDDKDTSYYLRMYLSCYRAVEYLKSRPDWDGKTLVVMGTSQGGQQTLVTAGLHPDGITAALPFLPAACDVMAPDAGRASGFPFWYTQVQGKDPAKVREASRYYDPVNFARRIKCPVLIGMALRDDLAPPSSVLAAANVITTPKEVVILPTAGHQDQHGSQKPFNDRLWTVWLPALREGRIPDSVKPTAN